MFRVSWKGGDVIFGADDSSVHINGRNINILVLGEGPTQGFDNSIITAKAKYPLNFTESGKRFVFKSAFIMEAIVFYLLMH